MTTYFDIERLKAMRLLQNIDTSKTEKVKAIKREFSSLKNKGQITTIQDAEEFFTLKLMLRL